MSRVVVVGSGASAVVFAAEALDRGWDVLMLDVGRERPEPRAPELSFLEMIETDERATEYFLGDEFDGLTFPGNEGEYYGFPPHRAYIFEGHDGYALEARGFEPLQSFARGGLAEAWTGGCFPFSEEELSDFPFGYDALGPFYGRVAARIGIMGKEDDLSRFMPLHDHLSEPVPMDAHSKVLLERYARHRDRINAGGVWLGRSRMAVLGEDRGERRACTRLGRCLWGCPRESIFTPALLLSDLQGRPGFEYRPDRFVTHFDYDDDGRVGRVFARPEAGGAVEAIEVERLALGAGALASSKIYLDSIREKTGELRTLCGLMDNRQILLPFVNLARIGRAYDADAYQYHQLAFGVTSEDPRHYVHGLVTTLKTAMIHPVVQSVPLDVRTALAVFRHVHGALGLVNVNFWDERRDGNTVRIVPADGGSRLEVRYEPPAYEAERSRRAVRALKRALWRLGCVVPPGMAHTRPMGASVHYAGLLPMTDRPAPDTTDRTGRSHELENLWLIDGVTFPFLPAKNVTFTLMANAARIVDEAFGRVG